MAKNIFELGKELKKLRESKNIKPKAVYDKICLRDEYWRYENGYRQPSWSRFEKFLQRLGEEPRSYFVRYAMTLEDTYTLKIRNDLKFLLREETDENYKTIESLVNELEQNESFYNEKLNRQLLFRVKATIAFYHGDYESMLDYSMKGILITKPDFDGEKIASYTLFYDEILLINQIAVAQAKTSADRCAKMLFQLKTCLDGGYIDEEEKSKTYMHILFNLSNILGILKRYEDCLSICEKGIEFCVKHENSHFHPMFMFNRACCLFGLDKKNEGIVQLEETYAIVKAVKRFTELTIMKNYVEETFGITI